MKGGSNVTCVADRRPTSCRAGWSAGRSAVLQLPERPILSPDADPLIPSTTLTRLSFPFSDKSVPHNGARMELEVAEGSEGVEFRRKNKEEEEEKKTSNLVVTIFPFHVDAAGIK